MNDSYSETDQTVAQLKQKIMSKLAYSLGKTPRVAQPHDWLTAGILTIRDEVVNIWHRSTQLSQASGRKRVYYLSLEFLIGRQFADALNNLGLTEKMTLAMAELGVDLAAIEDIEPDAALGNGGLGRLAACYMESMASVGVATLGYGIRYDHGLFKQGIVNGEQVEMPEDWLEFRNPWEFERRESAYQIGFGGTLGMDQTTGVTSWTPQDTVFAVAYDTPIVGWHGKEASTLRLWSAKAKDSLQLATFNEGDHAGAFLEAFKAKAISNLLYPVDTTPAGQELRLKQEYFFTSASLQDLVRRHKKQFGSFTTLPDKVSIQLNDTHPSLAVAELMRLLVDIHGLGWDEAWDLTTRSISYTNHTLLPEALETWPVALMDRLLPRHMQIIFQINAKFLNALANSEARHTIPLSSVSLIDEDHGRRVRMAHLAFIGSHTVNGVSELHSRLMQETVFEPLHRLQPHKITNVTNGITPRRWLLSANPGLTALVADLCGHEVTNNIERIEAFRRYENDASVQDKVAAIRLGNKQRLAARIQADTGIVVNPAAMFDIQVKRIHEYKRQLLNILETIALYNAIRAAPYRNWVPRVKIFAGKSASNYATAKAIIHLINDVANVVNSDVITRDLLKVVFLPNYNVSLAEIIIPAADVSEQISTAGMEASGTGNMKFSLNGALTIGTLDGANIEIRERVGAENLVIFGLTAAEVAEERASGAYRSEDIKHSDHLADTLDAVASGAFSTGDVSRYAGLIAAHRQNDWFMVLRDFESYREAQRSIDVLWEDKARWWQMAIANTAGSGWFSADRAIRQYARDIWHVEES